jgi:hypothetical protein
MQVFTATLKINSAGKQPGIPMSGREFKKKKNSICLSPIDGDTFELIALVPFLMMMMMCVSVGCLQMAMVALRPASSYRNQRHHLLGS